MVMPVSADHSVNVIPPSYRTFTVASPNLLVLAGWASPGKAASWARASLAEFVVGVVDRALPHREAAAGNALGQAVANELQLVDAGL